MVRRILDRHISLINSNGAWNNSAFRQSLVVFIQAFFFHLPSPPPVSGIPYPPLRKKMGWPLCALVQCNGKPDSFPIRPIYRVGTQNNGGVQMVSCLDSSPSLFFSNRHLAYRSEFINTPDTICLFVLAQEQGISGLNLKSVCRILLPFFILFFFLSQ